MKSYAGAFAAATLALTSSAAFAATDTVTFPTEFFTPSGAQFDLPFYRGAEDDWGWTHGAITDAFTTASLNISAFDVDFSFGELDEIFVSDGGTLISLGFLDGASDIFSFTEFVLPAAVYDDIATGLEVFMDIDVNNAGWLVSLGRSVITTDGADPGNPNPPPVPLPASGLLLLGALGGIAAMRRRKAAA